MNAPIRRLICSTGWISMLLLSGCATSSKNLLPQGGYMTMNQIYDSQTGAGNNATQNLNSVRKKLAHWNTENIKPTAANTSQRSQSAQKAQGWVRQNPFRIAKNPVVPFYVYPHLVHNDAGTQPVPGYTSAFFLSNHNHFATAQTRY